MPAFAKTRGAADHIYQHATGGPTRHQALVLLRRLRACEAALASGDGHIPALAQGLLPSLIPAVRELAGSAWPATADDNDPAIGAITFLSKIPDIPPLSELDEILARILRHRFAAYAEPSWPAWPGRPASPADSSRRASQTFRDSIAHAETGVMRAPTITSETISGRL